jgi:putative membrane protein
MSPRADAAFPAEPAAGLVHPRDLNAAPNDALRENARGPMPKAAIAVLTVAVAFGSHAALAQGGGKPTDPQIAHIAYTAGQIDIKAAELARKQSKSKEVRAFANDMLRDHKAVNAQALALVKKLNVKPEDNDTSRSLTQQAAAKEKELRTLKGAAFDRAYAQNEVAFHQTVNGALQSTLIPSAQNAELKDLLSTGLRIFQGHQQHAEQLAQGLR